VGVPRPMYDHPQPQVPVSSVCVSRYRYDALSVKHEPLSLIPPQFETPLPPLAPAVFPPAFREPPPPALDLFDLDEQVTSVERDSSCVGSVLAENRRFLCSVRPFPFPLSVAVFFHHSTCLPLPSCPRPDSLHLSDLGSPS
jgi:hypothetical protein